MRKLLLFTGAAAMAIAAPAVAEKGGNKGGKGGGQAAHAQHKPDKPRGGDQGGGKGHGHSAHHAGKGKPDKAMHHAGKGGKSEHRLHGGDKIEKRIARAEKRQVNEEMRRQERFVSDRFDDRDSTGRSYREARYDDMERGCPPGLAKKRNGCLPPGQDKRSFTVGDRIQPVWFSGYDLPDEYRDVYYDTDDYFYRYDDDGYIYRVNSDTNVISALIPLLGGGFSVGQLLPAGYEVYNVPLQYRDLYQDSDDYSYRYGDDAIYRVDNQTNIIESIVALLAGNLNVGQMLPSGYDAYNVPLEYRDQYADNEDYLYRYGDGNIYQVDAKTQIIQAIVEMLV